MASIRCCILVKASVCNVPGHIPPNLVFSYRTSLPAAEGGNRQIKIMEGVMRTGGIPCISWKSVQPPERIREGV
ncbi:hypothetical protein POX_a01572 [Penicillium oxalicum]|uniref:Uncharacterized protein n=1 Tax=Penicillium oxalicum (strain 114-2 / CGMCC 5302) TaxID=933388 RepID=S7ZXE8_PENO1|nr:hypothetical protein POX_a01572 [Penicillium oxalicum]EPS33436.1 hypothetical protein PDE_08398 [Penicillium oxalicum 114-2]KAI2794971.1 hypothetical protein POX_a01572 [Penicillium oxalicum]